MPPIDDNRFNLKQRARKTGPLGGRPTGPASLQARITGRTVGPAPIVSPIQPFPTMPDPFAPAPPPSNDPFSAIGPFAGRVPPVPPQLLQPQGPAPLPGSAVAPETIQGPSPLVNDRTDPSAAFAPGAMVGPGGNAIPGTQNLPTDPNIPFAGIDQAIAGTDAAVAAAQAQTAQIQGALTGSNLQQTRQVRSDLLTARGGRTSDIDTTGLVPLPPTELETQQRLTAASQANQLGDVERFEARQRAPLQQASTAFQGAFRAGDTENQTLFQGGDIGAFAEARRGLAGRITGGLAGEELRAADRDIGAFSPTGLTSSEAAAQARNRFRFRRTGRGDRGEPLDPGQLKNIADREQELARRELRRTNRGVGARFDLTDEQADAAIRRQAIQRRLTGEGAAPITEEESQALRRLPGSTIQAIEAQQFGQAGPEGVAAIERRAEARQTARRALTGPTTGDPNQAPVRQATPEQLTSFLSGNADTDASPDSTPSDNAFVIVDDIEAIPDEQWETNRDAIIKKLKREQPRAWNALISNEPLGTVNPLTLAKFNRVRKRLGLGDRPGPVDPTSTPGALSFGNFATPPF